jgi:hypothetical protein
MAKANSTRMETPVMSSKLSKKPSQQPKSVGRQTTLFGFFSKSSTQTSTPVQKRVEARSMLPLTPLPSSEVDDDMSPIRLPVRQNEKETGGLMTPVTPAVDKNATEMEIDIGIEDTGSRNVGFSLLKVLTT